jgi:sec-independent protein translocase protein TatA
MFGAKSLMHWIIVLGIFLLLFGGRSKISDLMGDVAKGIKSFKKGLSEDDTAGAEPADAKPIDRQAGRVVDGSVDRKVG